MENVARGIRKSIGATLLRGPRLASLSTLTHNSRKEHPSMAPPKPRQQRSDSASAAVQAAVNVAKGDPMPPKHVSISPAALPHYLHIVRARARDEWNDLQLTVAAQLAECFVEQDEERAEMAKEGRVLRNERGTMVANPRVSILEQMARRQMALMRTLQMGGRTVGDPRQPLNKRKSEQTARKLAKEIEEEDDLLA